MDGRWRIELLGGLRAERGDRVVAHFPTQKTGALLAYLAYYPDRTHSREELIELLWPEVEAEKGRQSLRQTLFLLRHQLQPPLVECPEWRVENPSDAGPSSLSPLTSHLSTVIVADRASVRVSSHAITTDVAAFGAALQSAKRAANDAEQIRLLAQAAALYRGELLPGYFDDWVQQERQWLSEQFFAVLGQLLAHLEGSGEFERALEYARQGVRVDPLREETHLALLRLLAAAGHLEAAVRQYAELARLMEEQLGAEPSPEVQAFAEEIRARVQSAGHARAIFAAPPDVAARVPVGGCGNLPYRLTRFFGRKQEIARLRALLQTKGTRLVTLTGPGGSGKTRLALETVGRLRKVWPGGIWVVPLQDLIDPRLIAGAVLDALGVPRAAAVESLEQLVAVLSDQPRLLVLDNLEHLIAEGAPLVRKLLERVAALTVLVTSRQRLGLPGERQFSVPPLPVPVVSGQWSVVSKGNACGLATDHWPLTTLVACPSVRLFVDRAQAVRPEFQVTVANAAAVAGVCARLEGLPLALELAAARIGVAPPEQMLGWLEQRFEFLVSRERQGDRRHLSLRAALDASFRLLAPELQRFFARLSVFRGGWTLEAAAEILDFGLPAKAGVSEDRTPLTVSDPIQNPKSKIQNALDCLEELRESSLVLAEASMGATRYRLLETLREYGAEQLAPEERAALAERHVGYYLALAEAAEPELQKAAQGQWLQRLEVEHDNMRAALAWCFRAVDRGQWLVVSPPESELQASPAVSALSTNYYTPTTAVEMGLRVAGALGLFWYIRGYWVEGRDWVARLLTPHASPNARAKALQRAARLAEAQDDLKAAQALASESLAIGRELGDKGTIATALQLLGWLAHRRDDSVAARALQEESLAIQRQLGNQPGIAASLNYLGYVAQDQGDHAAARPLFEESLAIRREPGDRLGSTLALNSLGQLAYHEGRYAAAHALYAESLAIQRELEDKRGLAYTLNCMGEVLRCQGDYAGARELYQESLALWRQLGTQRSIAGLLANLGSVAQCQGDAPQAAALFAESLALHREVGGQREMALCLAGLAGVGGEAGRPERAAQLFGAVETLLEAAGAHMWPADRAHYDRHVADVRAAMGAEAFAAAWAEGRALPLESAIALALADR